MRLVVDQAHLAEVVAGVQRGQDHLAATAVGARDAGAAGQDDVQRIGFLALLHDDLGAFEALLDDRIRNACGLRGRQRREQWNAPKQFKVGQHRH
ncbi:hypothetical protein D3C72_2244440 [compost metagenome]